MPANGIEELNDGVIIPEFSGGTYWSVDDEYAAALLNDPNYKISFTDDDDVYSVYSYVSVNGSYYETDNIDVYDNSIYSDRIIKSCKDKYPDLDLTKVDYFDFDQSYRSGSGNHTTAPVATYEPMLIKAGEGLYTINNNRLPYGCASVVALPPVGADVSEEESVEIELLCNGSTVTTFTMGVRGDTYCMDIQDMSGVIQRSCNYEDTIQLKAPEGWALNYQYVAVPPTVISEEGYWTVIDPQKALADPNNDLLAQIDYSKLAIGSEETKDPMLVSKQKVEIYISDTENASIDDCEIAGTVEANFYNLTAITNVGAMRISMGDISELIDDTSTVKTMMLVPRPTREDGMTDNQYNNLVNQVAYVVQVSQASIVYAPADANDDLLTDLDPDHSTGTMEAYFYELEDKDAFFANPDNRLYCSFSFMNSSAIASVPVMMNYIPEEMFGTVQTINPDPNHKNLPLFDITKDPNSSYYYVTAGDILAAFEKANLTLDNFEHLYFLKGIAPGSRYMTATYGAPVEIDVFDGLAEDALSEFYFEVYGMETEYEASGLATDGKVKFNLDDGKYRVVLSSTNYVTRSVVVNVADGKATVEGDTHLLMIGDINGDSEITYKDAMEAIQAAKGKKKYDDEYFYRVLDVKPTGDSTKVDYRDVLTLIQAANGKIGLWLI